MNLVDIKPIIIRGGGDIATGTISYLHQAGYPVIVLESDKPSAIRRKVSFCEAVYDKTATVENNTCYLYDSFSDAMKHSLEGQITMIVDPNLECLDNYKPDVLIDAILAKKNLGTNIDMADLVIGLGPGFNAGVDVNYCVETMRGHTLGTIIDNGKPIPNTGIPGIIGGVGKERVIHSPAAGKWHIIKDISDITKKGEVIAIVETSDSNMIEVRASIDGVIRGTIREGYNVFEGMKVADIDPRLDELNNCYLISDKAKTIAGAVLLLVNKYYFQSIY